MAETEAKGEMEKTQDAIALLKDDHRLVEQLFANYEKEDDRQKKARIARQICAALIVHTIIEEDIFYPACREKIDDESIMDEAQVEHDGAKLLIKELLAGSPDDAFYDAKVKVLSEEIKHHVREEEKRDGIFAKAKEAGLDLNALGQKLLARKQQLEAEPNRLPPPTPKSFTTLTPSRMKTEEMQMPRQEMPERDERGRFMSDDDDRRYQSRSRSRYEDNDDDRRGRSQGGWFGDSEGHSQAARRGWGESAEDDRRYSSRGGGGSRGRYEDPEDDRGRGSSRYDDGRRGGERSMRASRGDDRRQGGWFGDPEGHSQAARRGWDNPNHGDSGWYGDSEGHSEASRRGWQNPNHRPSGWFGDPEGHSEASRRGWERSDHEGSGWYGDSEGHSHASRRGWGEDEDSRGNGSRRSRSRDDDEYRGGRRGRYE